MNLGTQTVTLLRGGASGGTDEYGNPIPGDSDSEIVLTGCSVQPGGGSEFHDSREAITTLYTVWAPLTPTAMDTDRVRFNETVYELDGPVERWEVGTPLDHQVLRLKAVGG